MPRDNARQCDRCFTNGLSRGGTGVRKPLPGLGHKEWHRIPCATCQEVQLESGDCLLFMGSPEANVAHGSLGTRAGTAPSGLPSWCYRGRVSVQYRVSAGYVARDGGTY